VEWLRVRSVVALIAVSLIGVSAPVSVSAQSEGKSAEASAEDGEISEEKEKLIRELIEVSKMTRMGKQVMDRMFQMMKQQHPDIPEKYWTQVREDLDMDELVEKLIPIFDKYYTKSDLKKLLEFYKSPVGQKLVKVQPQITKEAMAVGREWGRSTAEEVVEDIRERQSESGDSQESSE